MKIKTEFQKTSSENILKIFQNINKSTKQN